MKILVCVDGSEHSKKAVEKAAVIAEGCNVNEVTIIHVDEGKMNFSTAARGGEGYALSVIDTDRVKEMVEEHKEERNKLLQEALNVFEAKDIKARTMLKEGHPSLTIVKVAAEEEFDMIVIGSRGFGGLKKLFLGSVSNAIVQEAKNCSVVVVK